MASILVRNLDEKIVKRLKENAKQHGRSLQGEVKEILTNGAKMSLTEMHQMLQEWNKRWGKRKFSDSTEMIREDRDR
jgi:plasmid stability protein